MIKNQEKRFHFWNLDILRIIPILHNVISRDDPPYDKKGRVTPVTGINPTTTIKLRSAWKANPKVIPNERYLPNGSFDLIAIFKDFNIIIKNKLDTINIPIKPNSSLMIENIKSVCGSGK